MRARAVGCDSAAAGPQPSAANSNAAGETYERLGSMSQVCAVCLDKPAAGAEVCRLKCGHEFCRGCIEKWWRLAEKKTCPACRKCFPSLRRVEILVAAASTAAAPAPPAASQTLAAAAPATDASPSPPPTRSRRSRSGPTSAMGEGCHAEVRPQSSSAAGAVPRRLNILASFIEVGRAMQVQDSRTRQWFDAKVVSVDA
eukprot:SAG11_NODE_9640_length_893_cov_0.949622_1_plen_198_part_10